MEEMMHARIGKQLSRRAILGGAAVMAATPALARECLVGPEPHAKGPTVWMDMDQVELDAAYDQDMYAPLGNQIIRKRFLSASEAIRGRFGEPRRESYGPAEIEKLDIYATKRPNAPIFVYIHGGNWLLGSAKASAFPVELFMTAGVHYVALDFAYIKMPDINLPMVAQQVRRGIAWVYKNASTFGGDPNRLYIGGFSSGGHLCGVALVTDWEKEFGLPPDMVKGGLCMSGLYDMKPVRLSKRDAYVKFTDEVEQSMSSQRYLNLLRAPVIVTYGTNETPEFQRQNRDFAAAVKAAGKPVQLIVGADYNHFEMAESLNNPYAPNGRAALALMKLS
jgi:arylformamidase